MKEIVNFLVGLVLFLLAWALFLPISFLNFFIVGLKFKDLGKNQRDNTLSFAGKVLVFILDTIDKNHCKKSIKEF